MIRHKVITLSAASQNLATLLGIGSGDIGQNGSRCAFFSMQALGGNSGIVYIGGKDDTLTATSAYGIRLEIPVTTVPSAPFFRESKSLTGALELGDYILLGTAGDKLSIMWEPL